MYGYYTWLICSLHLANRHTKWGFKKNQHPFTFCIFNGETFSLRLLQKLDIALAWLSCWNQSSSRCFHLALCNWFLQFDILYSQSNQKIHLYYRISFYPLKPMDNSYHKKLFNDSDILPYHYVSKKVSEMVFPNLQSIVGRWVSTFKPIGTFQYFHLP